MRVESGSILRRLSEYENLASSRLEIKLECVARTLELLRTVNSLVCWRFDCRLACWAGRLARVGSTGSFKASNLVGLWMWSLRDHSSSCDRAGMVQGYEHHHDGLNESGPIKDSHSIKESGDLRTETNDRSCSRAARRPVLAAKR